MQILYFTQLFYPALFGGGEFIFYHWALQLVERGHQVFVITQKLRGQKSYEEHNGVVIYRVGSELDLAGTLPIGISSNLSFFIGSILKGLQIAKEKDIDIIHSNTYVPAISAHICSKIQKIPHIVTFHDVYSTSQKNFWRYWSNQPGVSKIARFVGPLMEKIISKMSVAAFHTVSNESKSDLEKLGVTRKIKVIPNGIDLTQYEMENNESKTQAIYIGRLVFYKNLDILIEAFSKVVKAIPSAKLVILGDGPMKDHLIQKVKLLDIQEYVLFTGQVSDKEKIRLISQSRVLLNPSLVEGFGIVVLEGFACGKPVIVSDSKPLSNLVDDLKDGFVVDRLDSQKWADKITYLLSNSKEADKMGKRGKEKTILNYDISKVVNDLTALYLSLKNSA